MPRRSFLLGVLLAGSPVCALAQTAQPVSPSLDWRALETPDLTIAGGAPEATLRRVGVVLRRFRDAVEPVLPSATRPPARPTTVIVFPRRQQLARFAVGTFGDQFYQAGVFVGGMTSNYILITAADGDFTAVYHEYVHLIVHEHLEGAPAWFHEGLAEFFRTFSIDADGRAYIGNVSDSDINLLRGQGLMPLSSLLAIGFDSPLYQKHDTNSVFYAQSGLLVHYLMLSDQGRRAAQLQSFVAELVAGVAPEQASLAAFKVGLSTLDQELRQYLARDTFPRQRLPEAARQGTVDDSPVRRVAESDAHTVLGEVFLEMRRHDDAQHEFEAALLSDPDAPRAHAGYGLLLAQQDHDEEARAHLEHAARAPDASWATLVSYAGALFSLRPAAVVDSPGPDDIAIEQALRRAIALEPSRPVAHANLAQLLSLDSNRIAEARRLAAIALKMAPADEELRITYAVVLVNAVDYATARPVLEGLAQARNPKVRQQAEQLLPQVAAALARTAGRTAEDVGLVPPTVRPRADALLMFRELQQGEHRSAGWLVTIECLPNGLVVVTRTVSGTLRLAARSLQAIDLINYNRRRTSVRCGAELQGDVVVASYVPDSTTGTINGRLRALEFAPDDYVPAGAR